MLCFAQSHQCLLVDFSLKENFITLAHGSLALIITHPIVNLGPRRFHKITEQVDNTVVPSNLAPSEFSPLYASCDEPGLAEFLFSLRTPTPIAHMHVSIFTMSPSKLIRQNIYSRDNYHSTKSRNPGISHNFHHFTFCLMSLHLQRPFHTIEPPKLLVQTPSYLLTSNVTLNRIDSVNDRPCIFLWKS